MKRIRLTEGDLHQIIKESVYRILRENEYDNLDNYADNGSDYDDDNDDSRYEERKFANVSNEDIAKFNGNYYEVVVPDVCLPYLVNGELTGYEDDEIQAMEEFENKFLSKGVKLIGDYCIPEDDAEPYFSMYNDVSPLFNGADCYKFLIPA